MMNQKITIRPEEHKDYKRIVSLIFVRFKKEQTILMEPTLLP